MDIMYLVNVCSSVKTLIERSTVIACKCGNIHNLVVFQFVVLMLGICM